MLACARRKVPVPAVARWLLGLGTTATLAANIAPALTTVPLAAQWPLRPERDGGGRPGGHGRARRLRRTDRSHASPTQTYRTSALNLCSQQRLELGNGSGVRLILRVSASSRGSRSARQKSLDP